MIGILILTGTAFICSIILVFVSSNKTNSNELNSDEIKEHLPNVNCGTCGYAGCKGMAEAILEDVENYKKCRILRKEKLENFENYLKEKGLLK